MKIAMLTTYPPAQCGIGTYSFYLSSALTKEKETTINILTEKTNPEITTTPISVHPIYAKEDDYTEDFIQKLKELQPDVVHIQHEFGLFGWDERILNLFDAIRELNIPSVITIHTVYAEGFTKRKPKNMSLEEYYREIGKRADKVIIHQENSIPVLSRMGIDDNKLVQMSHGTLLDPVAQSKTDLRKQLGLIEDAATIMYFGFLKDDKLTMPFIESLPAIFERVPNAHFYIVGSFRGHSKRDEAHVQKIKTFIKDHNLEKKVTFINKFIVEEEVPLYLAAADVITYPYDIPYWGDTGSAHRAIGAGAVLAVSRIPKFDEMRNEIHEEMAVLPHNSKHWANCIARLLQDQSFHNYIKEKTEAYAKKTSWEEIAKQQYDIYQSVLK